jgi:AcrR family transcriptional regulator
VHETKTRPILEAAATILERDGVQAVSTRSVAAAAGIRAASLYQLFGDMDGLLAALAVHGFERYLGEKHSLTPTGDPVADLRQGWDMHVDFGLRHPAFYVLMFGTDRPQRRPPAAEEAHALLLRFFDRVAAQGRLRVPPPTAATLSVAAITGVTLALLGLPPGERDRSVSAKMRETMVAALTTDPPAPAAAGLAARALALNATLGASDPAALPFRPAETALLRDWLTRLSE